ncbi:MAG: serine--tRNA ligase [Rhodospirillales bacterium]
MFDIKWIRDNPDAFDEGLGRRGLEPASAALVDLDGKRRRALTRAQEIQAERKTANAAIGVGKSRGEDVGDLIEKVTKTKKQEAEAEEAARAAAAALDAALAALPNLPAADVPEGADETANEEIRTWGDKPGFAFPPKEHFDIGEALGMMDFETAARMSGARFVLLTGALARMERALASFMLDLHTGDFGYTEVNPPALVRDEALFGTGQLPKFGEDLFGVDNDRLWLIPTAEVPLTNIVAGRIVDEAALPLRLAAMTWCFRSEAGSAGKDTRGMIRQHQFTKVELVTVSRPDESDDELERMTACAEEVLKRLGLPFRTVVLSTGDMGFAARKTYDIEAWLPGQGRYREISSCSNCGDFQARRMKARFRARGEKQTRFVHTLNGSALAVGRTLIAILENCQQADGSVAVPEALRPYMGGLERITPGADPDAA